MPFPEGVKRAVERRAHFRCCICHEFGVEIHHIIPQAENGPDTEDNAAPLCPRDHDIYGANPEKRRVIRDARDLRYEICEQRYKPDDLAKLERLHEVVVNAATKDDLAKAFDAIVAQINAVAEQVKEQINSRSVTLEQAKDAVAYVTGSAVSTSTGFAVAVGEAIPGQRKVAEGKTPVFFIPKPGQ